MRALTWSVLTAVALLLAACGGDGTSDTDGGGDGGTDGSTGSSSAAPDKAGSSGSGASGRRLNGGVCTLLTTAEVEAAIKVGIPLTPSETGGGREEDRSCAYIMQGVGVSALVVTLQGERERIEPNAISSYRAAYPRSVALQASGADGIQLDPSGPSFILHKNGLIAFVQPIAWPQTETTLSIATKLAQPIANRLP